MSDVCGVELVHEFPEDALIVHGIAIIQAIDKDGRFRVWASSTEGLSNLEAMDLLNQVRNRVVKGMERE